MGLGHQRLHLGAGHLLWLLAGVGGGKCGVRGSVGRDLSAGWFGPPIDEGLKIIQDDAFSGS